MKRLHELAAKYPRYGYRMTTAKLRQEGCRMNFKRIHRLRRQEGLKVPQKSVQSDVSVTTATVAFPTKRWNAPVFSTRGYESRVWVSGSAVCCWSEGGGVAEARTEAAHCDANSDEVR